MGMTLSFQGNVLMWVTEGEEEEKEEEEEEEEEEEAEGVCDRSGLSLFSSSPSSSIIIIPLSLTSFSPLLPPYLSFLLLPPPCLHNWDIFISPVAPRVEGGKTRWLLLLLLLLLILLLLSHSTRPTSSTLIVE